MITDKENVFIYPKIIAIAGGSGSGKTTTALRLQKILGGEEDCRILSQDSYYRDQSLNFRGDGSINYDHPDSIDFELMSKHLAELTQNRPVEVPVYDFVTHTRKKERLFFKPVKVIIVDGILLLAEKKLSSFFYASVFLDIPEEVRFARRLKRDVEERGRQPEGVKLQFFSLVKPMHDAFVQPSQKFATYVVTDELSLNKVLHKIKDLVASLS